MYRVRCYTASGLAVAATAVSAYEYLQASDRRRLCFRLSIRIAAIADPLVASQIEAGQGLGCFRLCSSPASNTVQRLENLQSNFAKIDSQGASPNRSSSARPRGEVFLCFFSEPALGQPLSLLRNQGQQQRVVLGVLLVGIALRDYNYVHPICHK